MVQAIHDFDDKHGERVFAIFRNRRDDNPVTVRRGKGCRFMQFQCWPNKKHVAPKWLLSSEWNQYGMSWDIVGPAPGNANIGLCLDDLEERT